jgi:hypothetical protein
MKKVWIYEKGDALKVFGSKAEAQFWLRANGLGGRHRMPDGVIAHGRERGSVRRAEGSGAARLAGGKVRLPLCHESGGIRRRSRFGGEKTRPRKPVAAASRPPSAK